MENEILLSLADSEMGVASGKDIEALSKALLAPESSDELYETAGGVVTKQSLEGMLANLTLKATDFTLWQDMNKIKAYSTVEEYDQQIGVGISDGGFVGQIENPEFRDPDFLKKIAIVKYMSEGWTVGDVAEATNTIIEQRTKAQRAAMTRLLRNLDIAMYAGNSDWIPKSIDGLSKTISDSSSDQIKDMRGGSVSMDVFNLMAQLITEGNGQVDNSRIYVSPAGVQNLSTIIESQTASSGDRKIIEMGTKGITIGGKISGIMTNFGLMTPRIDKLLGLAYESKVVPQYFNNASSTWVEGATSDKAPSMPSITLTNQAGTSGSLFASTGTRPSGVKYNYRVVARNANGRSVACAAVESTSVIAADGSILITITPNPADYGSKLPTCFEIYSEQVGGSGVYRYMDTVAAATNPLTAVTYTDKNLYIPGTARMFIVDQTSQGEDRVCAFSQLLPIHNTDLAKIGRFSQGLINLYGAMKYYKQNVLVEIRNIGVSAANVNRFNLI